MSTSQETGHATGTKDKDYNVIWSTAQCRGAGAGRRSRTASGVRYTSKTG